MSELKYDAKFGDWIQQGFLVFKDNWTMLTVASLLSVGVSVVSLGILAGPLMAGLTMIALALVDKKEPKPVAGDVFKGFQFFLPAFLFFLVWYAIVIGITTALSVVICVGQIAQLAVSFGLMPLLMFGIYLIVDQKMDFMAATKESMAIVKPHFLPLLALYVVAGIISSLGLIACCIGIFASIPIGPIILACAYRDIMNARNNEAAPVPPPTPSTTVPTA